jgi:hypothetical protein
MLILMLGLYDYWYFANVKPNYEFILSMKEVVTVNTDRRV